MATALRTAVLSIRAGGLFLAAGVILSAQQPPAQQPPSAAPQNPTFRSGTTIVPVDVRVLDKHGRPVTDLKREDFTVLEDNVAQEVALFAASALTPVVPELAGRAANPSTQGGKPSFTVINGNQSFPNPFRALDGSPAYVNDLSKPTATVSIADPATARPPDLSTPLMDSSRTIGQPPDAIARKSLAAVGVDVAETDRTVEKLYTAIDQLKHEDGEKHIVLVANTPPAFDRAEDIEAIAKAASDARVVIDVAQSGSCGCWGVLDLERLAKLTGGVAGVYSSPSSVRARIIKENGFEYNLGYYPKDATLDSRYRSITVKVNRPGLELDYRTGYYARKPPLLMDPDTRKRYNAVVGRASKLDSVQSARRHGDGHAVRQRHRTRCVRAHHGAAGRHQPEGRKRDARRLHRRRSAGGQQPQRARRPARGIPWT